MSCNILKPKIGLVEVIIVVVACVVVVDVVTSSLTAPYGLRSCHSRHHTGRPPPHRGYAKDVGPGANYPHTPQP